MDAIYTVEICGDNNTFTVEATVEYEPLEDWLTGNVSYRTHVGKALLVHGDRRRDVTDVLTKAQRKEITDEVDRRNLVDYHEGIADAAEKHFYDKLERGY